MFLITHSSLSNASSSTTRASYRGMRSYTVWVIAIFTLLIFVMGISCRVLNVNPIEDALSEACTFQETIAVDKVNRLIAKIKKSPNHQEENLIDTFLYDESELIHWKSIVSLISATSKSRRAEWRSIFLNRMARIHVDDVPEFIIQLAEPKSNTDRFHLLSQIKHKINFLTREGKDTIITNLFGSNSRLSNKAHQMLDSFHTDCVLEDLDEDNILFVVGSEQYQAPEPLSKYSNSTSFDAIKATLINGLKRLKPFRQKFGVIFLSYLNFDDLMGKLVESTPENVEKAIEAVNRMTYKAASGNSIESFIGMFQQQSESKNAIYLIGKITDPSIQIFNIGSQMARIKREYSIIPKINTIGFFVNDPDPKEYLNIVSRMFNQYSFHTGGKCIRLHTTPHD